MARERRFRFGITAHQAKSGAQWRAMCRKAEDLGFTSLGVPDHLGDQTGLLTALTSAAEATTTLRVGALVGCNDFRHPVMHAKELATLDVLSHGRVDWGMGAGWLAPEYRMAGLPFDEPRVRVERLIEAVTLMKGLFGDSPVTHDGDYYKVTDLDAMPKPVQRPHPPLLIGGGERRMLTLAATEADIVNINPPAPDGRPGTAADATRPGDVVDRQIGWLRAAAGDRFDELELSMVALPVIVTDDRQARANKLAAKLGVEPSVLLASPKSWVGSVEEISDSLEQHRQRWGVSYWVVPQGNMDAAAPIVARLSRT